MEYNVDFGPSLLSGDQEMEVVCHNYSFCPGKFVDHMRIVMGYFSECLRKS